MTTASKRTNIQLAVVTHELASIRSRLIPTLHAKSHSSACRLFEIERRFGRSMRPNQQIVVFPVALSLFSKRISLPSFPHSSIDWFIWFGGLFILKKWFHSFSDRTKRNSTSLFCVYSLLDFSTGKYQFSVWIASNPMHSIRIRFRMRQDFWKAAETVPDTFATLIHAQWTKGKFVFASISKRHSQHLPFAFNMIIFEAKSKWQMISLLQLWTGISVNWFTFRLNGDRRTRALLAMQLESKQNNKSDSGRPLWTLLTNRSLSFVCLRLAGPVGQNTYTPTSIDTARNIVPLFSSIMSPTTLVRFGRPNRTVVRLTASPTMAIITNATTTNRALTRRPASRVLVILCLLNLLHFPVNQAVNGEWHSSESIEISSSSFANSKASTSLTTSKNSPIVASFSLLDFGRAGAHSLPPPLHSLSRRQTNFSHLLVDPIRSHLYVGGTNYVLQLDLQLNLLRRLRTGPLLDSAHCSPTDCSGVDSKDIRLTNTYNKALLFEPSGSQLIACGSSKQGACFRWNLEGFDASARSGPVARHPPLELAVTEQMLVKVPVAANDENSSTVAFVGPAHYDQPASNVLYVAVTNTKLGTIVFFLTLSKRHWICNFFKHIIFFCLWLFNFD